MSISRSADAQPQGPTSKKKHDKIGLLVEDESDMDIDNNKVDGSGEGGRESKNSQVEENQMEKTKVEEKKDGADEKEEGKGDGSIYSQFTKRRRTSLRENKPKSTPQWKRRRRSPSAISSDNELN